jgi:hypothetical protein
VQWHIGQAAKVLIFSLKSNLANMVLTVVGSWSKIGDSQLHAQARSSQTTLRMKSPIWWLTPMIVEQMTSKDITDWANGMCLFYTGVTIRRQSKRGLQMRIGSDRMMSLGNQRLDHKSQDHVTVPHSCLPP